MWGSPWLGMQLFQWLLLHEVALRWCGAGVLAASNQPVYDHLCVSCANNIKQSNAGTSHALYLGCYGTQNRKLNRLKLLG
jgi:hypothetical protein